MLCASKFTQQFIDRTSCELFVVCESIAEVDIVPDHHSKQPARGAGGGSALGRPALGMPTSRVASSSGSKRVGGRNNDQQKDVLASKLAAAEPLPFFL